MQSVDSSSSTSRRLLKQSSVHKYGASRFLLNSLSASHQKLPRTESTPVEMNPAYPAGSDRFPFHSWPGFLRRQSIRVARIAQFSGLS